MSKCDELTLREFCTRYLVEIGAELWHSDISLMFSIQESELYIIYESMGKELIIERGSSDEPYLLYCFFLHSIYEKLNTRITLDSIYHSSSDDDISTIGKWAEPLWQREIGIATHHDYTASGEFLEPFHIFGDMPWETIFATDQ